MREISLDRNEFAELSTEILGVGGSFCFKAHGFSMYPFIRDGDVINIQPVNVNTLKVGNIAFYRSVGNRLVAHRIINKDYYNDELILTTRGDALWSSNEQVAANRILGQVVSVQRGQKVVKFNEGFWNLVTHLWIKIYPLGPLFFRLKAESRWAASWLLYRLQGLKFYRMLARKLIGRKLRYSIATADDAHNLSKFYGCERPPGTEDPVGTVIEQLESLESLGFTVIASVRKKIVGAAIITKVPQNDVLYPDWWIFEMRVLPFYRRAGIGEELVRMALKKAGESGTTRVNLMVFEKNISAVELYRKMGFQQISIPGLDSQLEEEVRKGHNRRLIMSRPVAVNTPSYKSTETSIV